MPFETPPATSSERILAEALTLFAAKGYDATSVREICLAAGITKPTLYHFFGSKEGVYTALVDGTLARFRERLERSLATPGSVRERLAGVARSYFDHTRQNEELMRFLFALVHNPPSSAPRTDFAQYYGDVVRAIARVVEDGIAAGELAPGDGEVRMLVFMGALAEAVCGRLINGQPELTDELAGRLVATVIGGWEKGSR